MNTDTTLIPVTLETLTMLPLVWMRWGKTFCMRMKADLVLMFMQRS